jgi:hypothetical protein
MPNVLRAPRPTGSPRRWAVCAAMLVGAAVLGGSLGALLVIAAVFVVIDAVIPMPRQPWAEADERFARAARRRRRTGPRLDVIDEGNGWAAVAERRPLGVQSIPLDSITGTVEEMQARMFDRSFRPDRSLGKRWKSLWMAQARGLEIPPVSVYRIGDRHVLRDGHHRVSVACDHGRTEIEADVVELR